MTPKRIATLSALALVLTLPKCLRAQSSTVTGVSRAANPAISANVLYIAAASLGDPEHEAGHDEDDYGAEEHPESGHNHDHGTPGANVQELELRLTSFVDPHMKADITLATHGTADAEVEEAFVTTVGLPANLALKAGKFLGAFGKQNPLHTHQYPFVERPLVHEDILGGEGLNEGGVELSWLLPTDWYADLTGGVYNGDNPRLFHSEDEKDVALLARLCSLFDLNDATTLELGVSGLTGREEGTDTRSSVTGADLTVKWAPLETQRYRALTVQAEYLRARVRDDVTDGGQGLVQLRLSRRWWAQGAYDWMTEADHTASQARALVAYVPTEFQALRLQYAATFHEGADTAHRVSLQYNFTIGSHPAHAY
ncbi:hypothetical protein HN371_00620 [Candidatus Poribacteria bacterium]|nr:hypothetical protein [Candidatus Poribacteria bacterium]